MKFVVELVPGQNASRIRDRLPDGGYTGSITWSRLADVLAASGELQTERAKFTHFQFADNVLLYRYGVPLDRSEQARVKAEALARINSEIAKLEKEKVVWQYWGVYGDAVKD